MTCCYDGVDHIFTGVPTTFVFHVLDGSHLVYNWTVDGPSYAIVATGGSDVIIVFNENASYLVGVTVWNSVSSARFWNSVSSISSSVQLESRGVTCFPPSVQLVGGTRRSELRSRAIRLETVVSAYCLDYRLTHEWSVWIGSCVDVSANGSVSLSEPIVTDTPTLLVPSRTLDYGDYCVQFRSCFHDAPGCGNVSVDLRIKESSLRALIDGGDERWIVVAEKIVFDGSPSYDPDVDKDAPSFLDYNWTCQVLHLAVLH